MNSLRPFTDILSFFFFFKSVMLSVIVFGQCSMNSCQWGSLTHTGGDKETDGSRLCGLLWLWPDCAALFTVGVRLRVCVHVCSCVHACTSKSSCVTAEKERRRERTTVGSCSPPPAFPADGFPLSPNAQTALRGATPNTKLPRCMFYCRLSVDGRI